MNSPFVAVFMVTYNHEKYIGQAIESVLMQKTSFPIKIFIGEDCSIDQTSAICLKYLKLNPENIEVILNKQNLGASNNAMQIFKVCFESEAKYIAMLEGDDYWTDPYKLQKQVDFLEANEDFALTFCNVLVNDESKVVESYPAYQNQRMPSNYNIQTFPIPKEITDIYDIAKGNYIHTPGVVFRNIFLQVSLPRYFSSVPIGDWPLFVFISQYGKIRFFEELMAVYRVHNGGQFSSMSEERKEYLGLGQYPPMINEGIFDDKVILIWEKHVVRKLANIFKMNYKGLNEHEIINLLDIFNSTKPSLLKKTIALLAEELIESKRTILSIQTSKTYRLSRFFITIFRIIRKILPFKSKITIY